MAAPSTPIRPAHAAIDTQFFEAIFVFSKINNCADLCGLCRDEVMASLVGVSKRAHAPDMFGISQAANPSEHIRTVTTLLGAVAIATVDKPYLRPVELGALLRSHSDRSWMPRLVDRWIGWLAPPGSLVGGRWTEAQAKLWLALAGFYDEADIVRSRNIRDFVRAHKDVIERCVISTVPGGECNVRRFAARLGYLAGDAVAPVGVPRGVGRGPPPGRAARRRRQDPVGRRVSRRHSQCDRVVHAEVENARGVVCDFAREALGGVSCEHQSRRLVECLGWRSSRLRGAATGACQRR